MVPNIKRILYTTDLSENSLYAFRYAMNSSMKNNAKIIALHVFEKLPPTAQALVETHVDKEKQKKILRDKSSSTIERIKNRIKMFCERELKGEPKCVDRVESIEVCKGYPAEEILKKADELSCDAIVMGTHGKGIIGNSFLGSTTKRVLRRVRKPVIIIPLPKGEIDITAHDFFA